MPEATPFDAREFRNTLSTFTTGVTIITTVGADEQPVGITVNSFNSVSLNPPMVLWSLARTSRSAAIFDNADHWGVHILSADQEALSNRFAKSGEDKFTGVDMEKGVGGIPLLPGCVSRLQCRTRFKYDGGDHLIFVGEVLHFDRSECIPLVFQAGKYAIAARKGDDKYGSSSAVSDIPTSFGEDFLAYLVTRSHFQVYARIRERLQQVDLDDASWFVISSLTAKGDRTLAELNGMYEITGSRLEPRMLAGLESRGLLVKGGAEVGAALSLTEAGSALAWQVLAEEKALEADLESKLGRAEAATLKNLLRQLIRLTDPGLPDMWGRSL